MHIIVFTCSTYIQMEYTYIRTYVRIYVFHIIPTMPILSFLTSRTVHLVLVYRSDHKHTEFRFVQVCSAYLHTSVQYIRSYHMLHTYVYAHTYIYILCKYIYVTFTPYLRLYVYSHILYMCVHMYVCEIRTCMIIMHVHIVTCCM